MNNIETAEQLAEIIETTGCDQGYYQVVTDDDFWAVCANHAL